MPYYSENDELSNTITLSFEKIHFLICCISFFPFFFRVPILAQFRPYKGEIFSYMAMEVTVKVIVLVLLLKITQTDIVEHN